MSHTVRLVGKPQLVLQAIPEELKGLKQWVVARISYNAKKSQAEGRDKFDKVPTGLDGVRPASSTDPTTWETLAAVCAACDTLQAHSTEFWYLPGFVLNGETYFGLDFDRCLSREAIDPQVAEMIAPFRAAGAYVEASCSGTGLRVIGPGKKVSANCHYRLQNGVGLEVYDNKRMLVITGACLDAPPALGDCQAVLAQLQTMLDAQSAPTVPAPTSSPPPSNPAQKADAPTAVELAKLKSALLVLSVPAFLEERNPWFFEVVCPLRHRFAYSPAGEQFGIALLDDYSSGRLAGVPQPAKYHGLADIQTQWASVSPTYQGPSKTLGSLYHHARQHGWVSPPDRDLEFRADGVYLPYRHPLTGVPYDLLISTAWNWQHGLKRKQTKEGNRVAPLLNNYVAILSYHPAWVGVFAYNELLGETVKRRPPSVRGIRAGFLTDADLLRAKSWLNREWPELDPGKEMVADAITVVADNHRFHPIRDYLLGLPAWDQTPRLDTLLVAHAGVADSPYVRLVTRKFLIGAVARVKAPGCKMDNSWCLIGAQGVGKSTLVRTLAVNEDWYADVDVAVDNKDINYIIGSKWFIEFGEMTSMRRSDVENMKQFLSKQIEVYRKAYDRCLTHQQRGNVFVFTGNQQEFLSDATGNRRYWPVTVGKVDMDAIRSLLPQVWAEAEYAHRNGERWYLTTAQEEDLCRAVQEEYYAHDPIEEAIRQGLAFHALDTITTEEIARNLLKIEHPSRSDYMKISAIMKNRLHCQEVKNISMLGGRGSKRGFSINRQRCPKASDKAVELMQRLQPAPLETKFLNQLEQLGVDAAV